MGLSSVCVFCSASFKLEPHFHEEAQRLGKGLAEASFKLRYGGSSAGLMGAVADGFLSSSDQIRGIIPKSLAALREIEHPEVKDLVVVDTLDERKRLMIEDSEAFVTFVGGYGTLDEFLEVVTWKQLGFIDKPIVLINYQGFWDSFLHLVEDLHQQSMIDQRAKELFHICSSSEEAVEYLLALRHDL